MTKRQEITQFMETSMAEFDIEDTSENRLAFLKGVQAAWYEDEDNTMEKLLWQVTLAGMVATLAMKMRLTEKFG